MEKNERQRSNGVEMEKSSQGTKFIYERRMWSYYTRVLSEAGSADFLQVWEEVKNRKNQFLKPDRKWNIDFEIEDSFIEIECYQCAAEKFSRDTLTQAELQEQTVLQKAWQKIKENIQKESEWEKYCYEILHQVAENHPIVAWVIAAVLLAVLLNLLSSAIYDGMK